MEYLTQILERKRLEVERRKRHQLLEEPPLRSVSTEGARAIEKLRRPAGAPPRVIAEIKRSSPSAGQIRAWQRGDIAQLARAYQTGGAAAVSVLCDRAGFAGSPLDLRRAVAAVPKLPVLFKEFVLDELQLDLAQAMGASLVLLIVRALPGARLEQLVDATLQRGLAPVVEAADANELERALATPAVVVGVNARDLRSFKVDKGAAQRALAEIPPERVAVHMSGVHTPADFSEIAAGRADAVLVGESLMRAPDPALKLRELRGA
ncbi:MAG TPA: indole-3-glycerol phosphate synthase TrpC [Polyangiales bacterium]|nr:indole-3-glycerol phosphate synthase TrpC [Polyangiales bacterium]